MSMSRFVGKRVTLDPLSTTARFPGSEAGEAVAIVRCQNIVFIAPALSNIVR